MYLNAEFQRITRREKQVFLHERCKKIEENNEMGETTDLLKLKDACSLEGKL